MPVRKDLLAQLSAITGIALVVLELQYVGVTTWAANHTSLHRLDNDSDPGAGHERED